MRYAHIINARVVEIIETEQPIATLYHPSTIWRPCGEAVAEGWVLDGDTLVAPAAPASVDLDTAKAKAVASVDRAAERARGAYITAGPGQSMVYADKAAEADRYRADADPDPEAYPYLSAEVGITGKNLAEVAEAVTAAHARWVTVAPAIEAARLEAKARVDAATTVDRITEIVAALDWPRP